MELSLPYLVPVFCSSSYFFFVVRTHLNAGINKRTGQCDGLCEQNRVLNPPLLLTDTAPSEPQQLRATPTAFLN